MKCQTYLCVEGGCMYCVSLSLFPPMNSGDGGKIPAAY